MNETACNEDHYMPRLMWPHGSSLWRNSGKLVPAAYTDSGGAFVGPVVGSACCSAVVSSSVDISSRRAGMSLTPGRRRASPRRVVISMASSRSESGASRNSLFACREDFACVAQLCRHVSGWCRSRRAVMSSRLVMMSVASRSYVVTSRDDVGRVAQSCRHVS